MIKSYFAQRMKLDPRKIKVVSIMPCTAKKFESGREELAHGEMADVDIVLTTRELASMIKSAGIDFANLPGESFDNPFGEGTGAGVIFGATGGVAEAALRTVFDLVAGRDLEAVDFHAVRGLDGIKETLIELPNGRIIRTAVVNGLGNARRLLTEMENGDRSYDFIEVMACPGGCIAGGGQPFTDERTRAKVNVREARAKAIYDEDERLTIRKSHKNPDIRRIYNEFLLEPNGKMSHLYLHTHYKPRSRF